MFDIEAAMRYSREGKFEALYGWGLYESRWQDTPNPTQQLKAVMTLARAPLYGAQDGRDIYIYSLILEGEHAGRVLQIIRDGDGASLSLSRQMFFNNN